MAYGNLGDKKIRTGKKPDADLTDYSRKVI